jgi:L-rhamnose mutarotase
MTVGIDLRPPTSNANELPDERRGAAPMSERVCFVLQVRPDRLDDYRGRHAEVWPEMREALRETGWRNYSLFLRDDGLLVGYLECDDFAAAVDAMQQRAVNERWQAEMAPFFELGAGGAPDTSLERLGEVFHLA